MGEIRGASCPVPDSGNVDLFFQNSCTFRSGGRHQEAALAQKELGMPHTHTHTHTRIHMHTCTHARAHTHTHAHTHVNTLTHMHAHMHICAQKAHKHAHVHTYSHRHAHIHMLTKNTQHTHSHTHTHTNHTLTHADIYSNPYAHTPSFFLPSLLSFFFLFVLNLLFQCKAGNDLQASSQETLPMNTCYSAWGTQK